MPHLSVAELIDAARGVLSEARGPAADAHVRECDACAEALQTWAAFAAFVQDDTRYEPPPDVLRLARAAFAARYPRDVDERTSALPAWIATLAFDSFATPALGMRTAGTSGPRHLLYEARPLAIDVQVQDAAPGVVLTGQISDASGPESPSRPPDVLLLRGGAEVARLECNEFGEFHGGCDRLDGVSLVIAGANRSIVIPLFRLGSDAEAVASLDDSKRR